MWDNWATLEAELDDSKRRKSDAVLSRLHRAYLKYGPKNYEKQLNDEQQSLNALVLASKAKTIADTDEATKQDKKKARQLDRTAWFRQVHPNDRRYTLISLDGEAFDALLFKNHRYFHHALKVCFFLSMPPLLL
jgi:hypothetical protein